MMMMMMMMMIFVRGNELVGGESHEHRKKIVHIAESRTGVQLVASSCVVYL